MKQLNFKTIIYFVSCTHMHRPVIITTLNGSLLMYHISLWSKCN